MPVMGLVARPREISLRPVCDSVSAMPSPVIGLPPAVVGRELPRVLVCVGVEYTLVLSSLHTQHHHQ